MNLKTLMKVRHDNKDYDVGSIILEVDLSKVQATRLISLGAAEETTDVPSVKVEKEVEGTKSLGDGDDYMTDEEVYEEISGHFNYETLKKEAESIGMTFAGNISKKDLVLLILKVEKEGHFLDQLPE